MELDVYLREIAAALSTGAWERSPMVAQLADAFGRRRAWMSRLVKSLLRAFEQPPRRDRLIAWLATSRAAAAGHREGQPIRRFALAPAEMEDSPWRVPALATSRELAMWLGVSQDALEVLADRRGLSRDAAEERCRHYRYTWIAKRTPGHRLIEAPKPRLRAVQRAILDDILAAIPPHAAAHGFRAARSVASFARPHVGQATVLRVDLQAFFSSVFAPQVAAIFRSAGYPSWVAQILAALATHRTPRDVLRTAPTRDATMLARLRAPHLPQGAPTSGALANLAAYGLDVRLTAYARAVDAQYTRYADDLVFSGGPALARAAPTVLGRISAIALDEGFAVNHRKTRRLTRAMRQQIAGIVVNDKLSVPRREVETLRAILHNCARTGPALQNREQHPDFRAYLLGRIAWVASLDAARGARLRTAFDRIAWDAASG